MSRNATCRASKKVFLQVLWTGSDESIPNLFLFTDSRRYIFNCSEGLQRLFTQCKVKFGKVDIFFMTRYQWTHMGGLPGFGMTMRDIKTTAGIEKEKSAAAAPLKKQKKHRQKGHENRKKESDTKMSIYAPNGIYSILAATRTFMRLNESEWRLDIREIKDEERKCYEDNEMIVYPIILNESPKGSNGTFCSTNKIFESINVAPDNSPPVISYACHLKDLPGKFLVDKAVELGVGPGKLRKQLIFGQSVTLDNGTTVHPEQVVAPKEPGSVFLVVDCPSQSFLGSLIENKTFQKYQKYTDRPLNLVVHLTNHLISSSEVYQSWMKEFPENTKHLFLDDLFKKKVAFKSQDRLQVMLNSLNNDIFPKLYDETAEVENAKSLNNGPLYNFCKINARDLLKSPETAIDLTEVEASRANRFLERLQEAQNPKDRTNKVNDIDFSDDVILDCNGKETLKRKHSIDNNGEINGVPNKKINKQASESESDDEEDFAYPEIRCFGTGASLPSRFRNVSASLLTLNKQDAVLLDCGEDTYGQMYRHFGKQINTVISKIKVILISHMHADHHLGLISFIKKLDELNKKPDDTVIIVGPSALLVWLKRYAAVSEKLKFKFVDCQSCLSPQELKFDISVQSVRVRHPGHAHGYVICHGDKKVTFSGDTKPCDNLISAGKDSTFLIHEATIEDDMPEEAEARCHSTTSQALDVAKRMNAKYVILTHFSQRYPKIPTLGDAKLAQNTVFAFDHMKVTANDFPKFHALLPLLTSVFSEEPAEDNQES